MLVSPAAGAVGVIGVVIAAVLDPGGGGICVEGADVACTGPVVGTVVSWLVDMVQRFRVVIVVGWAFSQ